MGAENSPHNSHCLGTSILEMLKKSLDSDCVFKNEFNCILKAEININTTVVH